jgi:hypothetical protein
MVSKAVAVYWQQLHTDAEGVGDKSEAQTIHIRAIWHVWRGLKDSLGGLRLPPSRPGESLQVLRLAHVRIAGCASGTA